LKSATKQSGVEPDECFIIGSNQARDVPDLAIEVVWTSGGIDKLKIYRRIGVAEVWFWQDGRIAIHVRGQGRFERTDRSRLFPDLDVDLLCSLLDLPTASQAVNALREKLRT